jgi:hypothetical protein
LEISGWSSGAGPGVNLHAVQIVLYLLESSKEDGLIYFIAAVKTSLFMTYIERTCCGLVFTTVFDTS